jgi:hypothetical protein
VSLLCFVDFVSNELVILLVCIFLNCFYTEGEGLTTWHFPSGQRNNQIEPGQSFARNMGTSAGILEEIALKSGSKVILSYQY